MQYSENNQKQFFRPFIDYIPAELKSNWIIVYYVVDPITQKLVRKRKRVPPHTSITERKKLAKKIIVTINSRLEGGWNPIIEDEAPKSLTLILDAATHYLNTLKRDFNTGTIRKDTLKTYKSITINFTNWLKENGKANEYVINFNTALISDFLDYIYIERKNTARTYNNYLIGVRLFSKYLIQKGYKNNDPTIHFKTKRIVNKSRGLIEIPEIEIIFKQLDNNYTEYSLVCKLIYYCYIRPTELSKLQVKDLLLKDGLIYLSPTNSKKSSGYLTIPKPLIKQLERHIKEANKLDYIFSNNECKTGKNQASGKFYYDRWQKHIIKKGLTKQPLYSLKDSGITFALDNGVSPVSVMNQARHTDLSITTAYLRKPQKKADENILNGNW